MEGWFDHHDHHGGGPPGYQQPQYILADDDHWPVLPGLQPGSAAHQLPPAAPQMVPQEQQHHHHHHHHLPAAHAHMHAHPAAGMVPQPLPQGPRHIGAPPPGKPVMVPVGLQEEDDATESEDERPGRGAAVAALAWQHHLSGSAAQPHSAAGGGGRRPESALTGGAGATQPSPTPSFSLAAAPAAAAAPAPAAKGGSKASKARKPGGKGGITLRLLIEEGILQPGHNVLSVDYKGMKQLAHLMPDGRISSSIGGQQMVFESPSAFSIYLKRLVNPSRKADDGWKTVRYNNRVLEQYKAELAKRRLADGSANGAAAGGTASTAAMEVEQPGQQHWQQPGQQQWQQQDQAQQPAVKRARVDSGSDLTGGSVAISATVKDGDRNVLKLKFARPKRSACGGGSGSGAAAAAAGASQGLGGAAAEAGAEEQTSHQRPRRRVQAPPRYAALGQDDEHALQPLEAYGPGAPGTPGAQPYTVMVSPAAEVVMDFHAHLCMNEVIGVLAGTYDAATRTISVLRAHPVRELSTEDDSINVEMDPEDQWRARQAAEAAGMRIVGFYHSHPTFPTQPSTIDIYNQVLQQHHHRDEATGAEPYVAAIVGPYDKRLLSQRSSLTWFYVDHPPGRLPAEGQRPDAAGCIAKALQTVQLVEDGGAGATAVAAMPSGELQELAQRYARVPDTVDLAGPWRDGSSRAQKLVASVQSWLPTYWDASQLHDFGSRLFDMVTATLVQRRPAAPPAISGVAAAESEDEAISSDDEA